MYHINGFCSSKKNLKTLSISQHHSIIKYYLKKNFSIKLIFIQRKTNIQDTGNGHLSSYELNMVFVIIIFLCDLIPHQSILNIS